MRKLLLAVLAVGLMMVSGTGNPVHALIIDYNSVLTGTAPGGEPPWLRATFTDVTGGVLLTVDALNLEVTEFTTDLYFNSLVGLTGLHHTNQNLSVATVTDFAFGDNTINGADGGHNNLYDLDIKFATSNATKKDPAGRLTNTEIASIFLYGVTGLTAESFNAGSETAGYLSQAHIQGIATGDGSSWIIPGSTPPVPEPGTMVLLGVGMLGLAIYGKRRMNKES